jgi:hypothetical protein
MSLNTRARVSAANVFASTFSRLSSEASSCSSSGAPQAFFAASVVEDKAPRMAIILAVVESGSILEALIERLVHCNV